MKNIALLAALLFRRNIKRLTLLLLIALFICGQAKVYAQPKTEAEAREMARKIMAMTPSQMIKFRDSMMKAALKNQAAALPNGDQLLIQHHYDTTYTTVHFSYIKTITESHTNGGTSGHSTYRCAGKSAKAPMMYEANGHTIVQCGMDPPDVDMKNTDKMVNGINKDKKYMTAAQAINNQDVARQMAFSSMTIKDNSLTGTGSENSNYNSGQGHSTTTTRPPTTKMAFSFTYDPVQATATIAVGATIHIHTDGSTVDYQGHQTNNSSNDTMSVGMGAATDPHFAKMVGAAKPPATNPDEAYIKVEKTSYGFKINYTKTQYDQVTNSHILETLTADIGGPVDEYEAVLKPMPKSKYETWLPKGPKVDGSDDTKGDDSSKFYVEVHNKNNPNKLYPGSFTVKYELKNRTAYKGFNSNYPVDGATYEKDMRVSDTVKYYSLGTFDASAGVNDSVATSALNNGALAILQVTCMDYGAWCKLTAHVTLDDGTEFYAYPYYDKGKTYITIPFDKDDNKIADAWEAHENILNNGYGLSWDEDVKPDNNHPGDNIALLDEYRGFLTEDADYKPVYTRLSPQAKELFTIGLADLTNFGDAYKAEIKAGALGYGRATNVKVYHFTNSKNGKHEAGEPQGVKFGRWVNFNSPTATITRGVAINASDIKNPSPDPNDSTALGTTYPIFSVNPLPAGYQGGQSPKDTREVNIWTVYIANSGSCVYAGNRYLPDDPGARPDRAKIMSDGIAATNAEFHVNIDAAHASPIVNRNRAANIARLVTFVVTHELCHATGMHHHHFDGHAPNDANDMSDYRGETTCPLRYWKDNLDADNCRTWVQMFIFGFWNPATLTTPSGIPMTLCTTGDDCFHQMKLK